MLVKNAMNSRVVVVKPQVKVKEAAAMMTKNRIGSVVVMERNKIVGILTERNILQKVVAAGQNPEAIKVEDIMSKEVVTIEADKPIDEAAEIMVQRDIKKLPVLEGGKLVGIITASDIVSVKPALMEALAKLLLFRGTKTVAG